MQVQAPVDNCCAIILAGGLNSRMGGRNKAFLKVGGRRIVDRTLGVLQSIFNEILIVTRQPALYEDLPARVIADIYPARSSLTGIHAGLKHAVAEYAFVVSCDAPFLKPELVTMLLDELEPAVDVVVPSHDSHFEPLCAIYAKRCIPHIEDQLERDEYQIIRFFPRINLKKVPVAKLQKADPQLRSFFNVNTPDAHRTSQDL
ncbi:MAG: molybdenum cofactor guanylyltransferase [Desulfosarcina sp.]|nr:molybdenum cofactor guanylyltransferase [Desulfobacterales bacterium]